MKKFMTESVKLTSLRKAVLEIVQAVDKPLKAYEILKRLRKRRPNAKPPTVYRVLDFLCEQGILHRIESTQAYAACQTVPADCSQHGADVEIILLCQKCGKADEYIDPICSIALRQLAQQQGYHLRLPVIEMKCLCTDCKM